MLEGDRMNIKDENERYERGYVRTIVEKACAADGHPPVVLNECACGKRAKANITRVIGNPMKEQLDYVLPYRE